MAITTLRTDDLDGSEGAVEVKITLDGTTYTVDLAGKNLEMINKFIDAGRTDTAPRVVTRRVSKSGRSKEELQLIREWANANGYTVAERGRIKQTIIDAYDAAN
jgi:Lsr2